MYKMIIMLRIVYKIIMNLQLEKLDVKNVLKIYY